MDPCRRVVLLSHISFALSFSLGIAVLPRDAQDVWQIFVEGPKVRQREERVGVTFYFSPHFLFALLRSRSLKVECLSWR